MPSGWSSTEGADSRVRHRSASATRHLWTCPRHSVPSHYSGRQAPGSRVEAPSTSGHPPLDARDCSGGLGGVDDGLHADRAVLEDCKINVSIPSSTLRPPSCPARPPSWWDRTPGAHSVQTTQTLHRASDEFSINRWPSPPNRKPPPTKLNNPAGGPLLGHLRGAQTALRRTLSLCSSLDAVSAADPVVTAA
jgi:hypothetical protein